MRPGGFNGVVMASSASMVTAYRLTSGGSWGSVWRNASKRSAIASSPS